MTEFELIARYFDRPSTKTGVGLGIGDDAALIAPRPGHQLAVSTDMLVAGRHFFADAEPASIGWKTLAVNLSDLAAMGARPLAFTLALALPAVDQDWLAAFSAGLFGCADAFDCPLIGGDTTRGPLTLCVTVFGDVAVGRALRRDAARSGDDIWVSGAIGGAALALRDLMTERGRTIDAGLRARLDRPVPRVALGLALAGLAHAAIDVSDGLVQDLGHIVEASHCGAEIVAEDLPVADALGALDPVERRRLALTGGDDYELCFTAPAARRDDIVDAALASETAVARIGRVVDGRGVRIVDGHMNPIADAPLRGFDHFA